MKIANTNFINQSYARQAAQAPARPGKDAAGSAPSEDASAQDSINLSRTTRDMQKISVAAENAPQDRAQMVQDLKAQVQSGQYTVNAEQVAEKIIGGIMNEVG